MVASVHLFQHFILVPSRPYNFSSELRSSNMARPDADIFDGAITLAPHSNNQCGKNKRNRGETPMKNRNMRKGHYFGKREEKGMQHDEDFPGGHPS